jgi:hypothetical protein
MNRRLRKRSANGRNDKKSIMRIQCTPIGSSDAVLASSLPPGGTESVATKPSAWPQVVVWRQHTLTCPDLRMPQAEFDAFDHSGPPAGRSMTVRCGLRPSELNTSACFCAFSASWDFHA